MPEKENKVDEEMILALAIEEGMRLAEPSISSKALEMLMLQLSEAMAEGQAVYGWPKGQTMTAVSWVKRRSL